MTIITENHENNYLNHIKFHNLSSFLTHEINSLAFLIHRYFAEKHSHMN